MANDDRVGRALENLRNEEVPEGAKKRLMASPIRSQAGRGKYLALGTAAVAVAIVFWPRQRALAWQQVVESTLANSRVHSMVYSRSRIPGKFYATLEEWIDGKKHAHNASPNETETGSRAFTFDWRSDGKRVYMKSAEHNFGEVRNMTLAFDSSMIGKKFNLETAMKNPDLRVVGEPERVVNHLKYRIQYDISATSKVNFNVFVDPESKRVVRTESLQENGEISEFSEVEYPAKVDPAVFEPPKDGIRVFDVDADGERLSRAMAEGVPLGNGNTLRAVIQSPTGEVVVLWTGTPANGDGSPRPSIIGRKIKSVFGQNEFLVSRYLGKSKSPYKFKNEILNGIALILDRPLAGPVTIDMPILVPDPSKPIKNQKAAFESKQVGTKTVTDFPYIETVPFSVLRRFQGPLPGEDLPQVWKELGY